MRSAWLILCLCLCNLNLPLEEPELNSYHLPVILQRLCFAANLLLLSFFKAPVPIFKMLLKRQFLFGINIYIYICIYIYTNILWYIPIIYLGSLFSKSHLGFPTTSPWNITWDIRCLQFGWCTAGPTCSTRFGSAGPELLQGGTNMWKNMGKLKLQKKRCWKNRGTSFGDIKWYYWFDLEHPIRFFYILGKTWEILKWKILCTSYCWWKKSCTSWYVTYPIIYKVLYIPSGAGFLPSTVSNPNCC